MSDFFLCNRFWNSCRVATRLRAPSSLHFGWAARARATAACTSASLAHSNSRRVSPVEGLVEATLRAAIWRSVAIGISLEQLGVGRNINRRDRSGRTAEIAVDAEETGAIRVGRVGPTSRRS